MRHLLRASCVFLLFAAVAGLFVSPALCAERKYIVGIRMDSSASAGQARAVSEKVAKVASERMKYDFSVNYFTDDATFLNAVKKSKVDFIYSWDINLLIDAVRKYGYAPFVSYSVFGTDMERNCFFVNKSDPAKKMSDIKGKTALVADTFYDYFIMRDIIGEQPEFYFGKLRATENFVSIFYPFSLGETDVVFASETLYNFFKMNNPGPVKNVRPLECSKGLKRFFLLHSKTVPRQVVNDVMSILAGAGKDPAFKEYKPLLKTTKMKFMPADINDFKPLFDLLDKGSKNGWDKDYGKWLKMQAD